MNKTLTFYNKNAQDYVDQTVAVDFSKNQNSFLERLPEKAHILDFGCGSGRDAKYFADHGYKVTAVDGSKELCKIASEYAGIPVKCMLFQELDEIDVYDGIWACSSILHLPSKELKDVFRKMAAALKNQGILYASFKYGTYEGERGGRYFTDMTEETFHLFLQEVDGLVVEKQWITADVRPGREEEKWLNVVLRKVK